MKDTENNDRYNLAKFKILTVLSNSGAMNSVQVAERTFKTVPQTTTVLNRLRKQKHIKQVAYAGKNDGCSSRFKITNEGKKYLLRLRDRFVKGLDLNLYYPPMKAELKDVDLQWWEHEKAIERKHLDEIMDNQKKPLSPEYAMNQLRNKEGAITQKNIPPKPYTQDEIDAILKDIEKKYAH
jgi:hypothetical protein